MPQYSQHIAANPTFLLPGIKGEARWAAPDLPPGGCDCYGCQQKFWGRGWGIKRVELLLARPPEVGCGPLLRFIAGVNLWQGVARFAIALLKRAAGRVNKGRKFPRARGTSSYEDLPCLFIVPEPPLTAAIWRGRAGFGGRRG